MNNQAMAQALRDLAQQQRSQQLSQQPGMQNQNSPDLSTNILQGLTKYNDTSGGGLNRMLSGFLKGGGGAAASGGSAAGAGGTGFGLGQPLVSGGVGSASFAGGGAAAGSGGAAGGMGSALMSNPWTAMTDLSELDFGNAFKNAKDGIKSIFKLRF